MNPTHPVADRLIPIHEKFTEDFLFFKKHFDILANLSNKSTSLPRHDIKGNFNQDGNKVNILIEYTVYKTSGFADTDKAHKQFLAQIKDYGKKEVSRVINILTERSDINFKKEDFVLEVIAEYKIDNPIHIETINQDIETVQDYVAKNILENNKILEDIFYQYCNEVSHHYELQLKETSEELWREFTLKNVVVLAIFSLIPFEQHTQYAENLKNIKEITRQNTYSSVWNLCTSKLSSYSGHKYWDLFQHFATEHKYKKYKSLEDFDKSHHEAISKLEHLISKIKGILQSLDKIEAFSIFLTENINCSLKELFQVNMSALTILREQTIDIIKAKEANLTSIIESHDDRRNIIAQEERASKNQKELIKLIEDEFDARRIIIKENNLILGLFQQQARKLKIVPEQKDPLPPEHNHNPKKLVRAAAAAAASDSDSDSAITKAPDLVEINTIINSKAVNLVENSNLFKLGATENCFVTNHGLADIAGTSGFAEIIKTGKILTRASRSKTGIKIYESGIAAAKTTGTGGDAGTRLILVSVKIEDKNVYFPCEIKDHKAYESFIANTEAQNKTIADFRRNFVVSGSDKIKSR